MDAQQQKITINGDTFNRIMKGLGPMASSEKSNNRRSLTQIKIEHTAGSKTLIAVALDGYRLGKLELPVAGPEGVQETGFDGMIPVVKPRKNLIMVDIVDDGRHIIISYFMPEGQASETYPKVADEFINWKKVVPVRNDPEYMVAVNAKYLSDALQAIEGSPKSNAVILKFGSRIEPILVTGAEPDGRQQYLVLPVRLEVIEQHYSRKAAAAAQAEIDAQEAAAEAADDAIASKPA